MRKRQFYDRRSRSQAEYGPLNGLSTDLVKLNSTGERRGKTQHLTIGEAGNVSMALDAEVLTNIRYLGRIGLKLLL
jgi:hypothetical protein